jgi:toxin ParE1/3/4
VKRLIILPVARQELLDIWDYSFENWGQDQADRYLASIDAMFARIVSGSAPSRPADEVRAGLRKVQVARHVVFFRESADAVEVVRVLHERMDVGQV